MKARYAVVWRSPLQTRLHSTHRFRWRANEEAGLMNYATGNTQAAREASEILGIEFDEGFGYFVEELT